MATNEADRIVRDARKRHEKRREAEQEAFWREVAQRQRNLVQAIQAEIPMVMQLLASCGYPGAQEIQIGRLFKRSKACWFLGATPADQPGEYFGSPGKSIFLLSDGRLIINGKPVPIERAAYDQTLSGLRELRVRLESRHREK